MLKFLPAKIVNEIAEVSGNSLSEVRIRNGKNIKLILGNENRKVVEISQVMTESDIGRSIMELCNFSLFSSEENLKRGFLTSSEGERVGLCGEVVYGENGVISVKNVTSLCVRFPREVKGVAEDFYYNAAMRKPLSCLIISPPFHGKTTFIRDLGRLYSDISDCNVLYIDERDELSASGKFDLGQNADVLKFATKEYGFTVGVRTLDPDVIVCDELFGERDVLAAVSAANSGVKIIASSHSDSLKNLSKRAEFSTIFKSFTFDRYVELQNGKVKKIYNDRLTEIC